MDDKCFIAVQYTSRMRHSADEIRQKYDDAAWWYDGKIGCMERLLGIETMRSSLLARASGNVLEVAVGTGRNFPYYPRSCRVTGVDLSGGMLDRARIRAERLGMHVDLHTMDAEHLLFSAKSFDTVVSTLATCTFPDPVAALREIARVCRGTILLLEHGRSDREWIGRLQDRFAGRFVAQLCCHWNREPLSNVLAAGIRIHRHRRSCLGMLHVIEGDSLLSSFP